MTTNDHDGHDPELDALFASARRTAMHVPPEADVDRLIAVAAATVERRRAHRLAAARVVGVGLILAVLATWIVGFARGPQDVISSVVMFAVPALAVLRWQMEALDGGGLRPWRTPPTMPAWTAEIGRQIGDLDRTIEKLDALRRRLEVTTSSNLDHGIATARGHIDQLRARLVRCRDGSTAFVEHCRTSPALADWGLLRDIDPSEVNTLLRDALTELDIVVRYSVKLDGDHAAAHLELCEARRETNALRDSVGPGCGVLVDAFDTLHGIATREVLGRTEAIGAVRRATSSIAVLLSGWGLPPAGRSASRTALLSEAADDGPSWGPAVRRARTAGREAVLVGGL